MINKAIQIATRAHSGQFDRDGEAYILHPLAVGLMGSTDEERAVGFLHDVLEDTDITADYLLQEGIPESVVAALQLLSRPKGMDYFQYVQNVIDSRNPLVIRVKYNDLQHNYSRGKRFPDLQAKHGKALQMIEPVVRAMEKVNRYDMGHTLVQDHDVAVFAAGCFWGVQHYFNKQHGVVRTLVGYTGGTHGNPTYDQVRTHKTDHVEAVLVEYNPDEVDYETLCKAFFEIHDTAQTDGQGTDIGAQYRSGVFYTNDRQHATIEKLMDILRGKGYEVNTKVGAATDFWVAEGYHQDYYNHTGGSPYCHLRVKKFD